MVGEESSEKLKTRLLSGSTDGMGITVTQTATAGDIIHTAVAGTVTGKHDEIWLWGYNGHTGDVEVSIEWGGTTLPRKVTIPSKVGLFPLIPGLPLQNSRVVRAFASVANVVVIDGFVKKLTD